MLIVKVYVNTKQIDEIHIQRVRDTGDDLKGYRIVKPEGFEGRLIPHRYSDGYMPLLRRALEELEEGT